MATIGWLRGRPPAEPKNGAVPSVKTPPSVPTIHAPGTAPSGTAAADEAVGSARETFIPTAPARVAVAATRPTRRRLDAVARRGRPMVRILSPNSPSGVSVPADLGGQSDSSDFRVRTA